MCNAKSKFFFIKHVSFWEQPNSICSPPCACVVCMFICKTACCVFPLLLRLGQALQQVVGAAAIYNHLLAKHGGVGTRPKGAGASGSSSSNGAEKEATAPGDDADANAKDNENVDVAAPKPAKIAACDCGGAMGSCKVLTRKYDCDFRTPERRDVNRIDSNYDTTQCTVMYVDV